ncbi:MAG: hypothetical protein A2Z45_09670 [Chloroflexi bacterium RBG_19FT_COMBO_55_16]|nr:MAG: hypothetical protein A2Z45_09670 [Chloroflexi bacterium RBG_19FT_COMBO_55_16]
MPELKRFSLVKPTLQTHFHIDFNWWSQADRNWRIDLFSFLCPVHQEVFSDMRGEDLVDWVDPETAEVQEVDGLQHILITHCAKEAGFIDERTTLVDGVFRILLASGNVPMTPIELADQLGRSPTTIMQTLSGNRVYKGLRPCPEC